MKVRSYSCDSVSLPLIQGYRIAGQSITNVSNFVVRIETDSGIVGHGCAAPAEDVTGESDEACRSALHGALQDCIRQKSIQPDPSGLGLQLLDAAANAPAACAAVDMALWDIAAQAAEQPLVRYLGGNPKPVATSVTIGISDAAQTLDEAKRWIADGFRILKIKTGDDAEEDIGRLRKLRESLAEDVVLRVDANQGYELEHARRFLGETRDLGIELFEQPLASGNFQHARLLVEESEVPIIADESVVSIADSQRLIERQAAHGINIKLMKCGGISPARVIHEYSAAAGLFVMLGCNDETRISIAAALHFAQAMPAVRYVDLDGHMDLARDPSTGGFEIIDGQMHLTDRPGLGVSVNM